MVLDSGLVAGAEAFEQSVASGERGNLRNFCINKKNSVMDTDEKETWEFLQVLFEEDARRQLLAHLGLQSAPSEVCHSTQGHSSPGFDFLNGLW